jgi:hypothetical protein
MNYAPRNEVFFAVSHGNALAVDDHRIAACHDQHVLVEIVDLGSGGRVFIRGPKSHLAAVGTIKNIAPTPGVAWLERAIRLAECFMNSGKSVMADNLLAFLRPRTTGLAVWACQAEPAGTQVDLSILVH